MFLALHAVRNPAPLGQRERFLGDADAVRTRWKADQSAAGLSGT
jgi:hypothetical protein